MTDPIDELCLQAGSLGLAARAAGPQEGTPVIALHGWLDNAASFDPIAPVLAGHGIRLVALDLPGHGWSDHRPAGSPYHLVDYVADVLDAADSLGWDRFALLGHSLGGAVATLLAGACPERVERLALVEALGPISDAPDNAAGRLGAALARDRRPPGKARGYADLDEAIGARQRAGDLSREATARLVERGTRVEDGRVHWRSDPRLRHPSRARLTEEQVLAFLRAIRAPVRVVAAGSGLLDPQAPAIRARLAALSNPSLERLPGGHHLHMEDPDGVAAAVGPFLASSGSR